MVEQFIQGFMAKCAQAGVHPNQLLKASGVNSQEFIKAAEAGLPLEDFIKTASGWSRIFRGAAKKGIKSINDIPEAMAMINKNPRQKAYLTNKFNQTINPTKGKIQQGQSAKQLAGMPKAQPRALYNPTATTGKGFKKVVNGPGFGEKMRGVMNSRAGQVAGAGVVAGGLGYAMGSGDEQGGRGGGMYRGGPAQGNDLQRLWDQYAQDFENQQYPSYVGHRS